MTSRSVLRKVVLVLVFTLGAVAAPAAFARHYGYSVSFGGPGYGVTYSDCHHCGGGWWSGYIGGGWASPGYYSSYYAPAYYAPAYYGPAYYDRPYYGGYYSTTYYVRERSGYRGHHTRYRDDDDDYRSRRDYRDHDGYRDNDRYYDRGREYGRRDRYYGR